ncbi:hypothetical protein J6590_012437 [Homalodisca vitripennis]|nr:hypothetical protein J6590_012437 [Homalodisca vitripennis]
MYVDRLRTHRSVLIPVTTSTGSSCPLLVLGRGVASVVGQHRVTRQTLGLEVWAKIVHTQEGTPALVSRRTVGQRLADYRLVERCVVEDGDRIDIGVRGHAQPRTRQCPHAPIRRLVWR